MKTNLAIFTLFLFGMTAYAQNDHQLNTRTGGGGSMVVCGSSVQLLDYWEASNLNNETIDLGALQLDAKTKVELVLSRLDARDHLLAEKLRGLASEFFQFTAFVPNTSIEPVPDANNPALPRGCSLTQIARQKSRQYPGENIYFVDGDLWNRIDNNQKAGLVLHEILYRIARAGGAYDSRGPRYFNGVISSSGQTSRYSDLQYAQVSQTAIGSNSISHSGLSFTSASEFYDNGSIKTAAADTGPGWLTLFGTRYVMTAGTYSFHENGNLRSAPGVEKQNGAPPPTAPGTIPDGAGPVAVHVDLSQPFQLDSSGSLTAGTLAQVVTIFPYEVQAFDATALVPSASASNTTPVHGYFTAKLSTPKPFTIRVDTTNPFERVLHVNSPVYCLWRSVQGPTLDDAKEKSARGQISAAGLGHLTVRLQDHLIVPSDQSDFPIVFKVKCSFADQDCNNPKGYDFDHAPWLEDQSISAFNLRKDKKDAPPATWSIYIGDNEALYYCP